MKQNTQLRQNWRYVDLIVQDSALGSKQKDYLLYACLKNWSPPPNSLPVRIRSDKTKDRKGKAYFDDRWQVFIANQSLLPSGYLDLFKRIFRVSPPRLKQIHWRQVQRVFAQSNFRIISTGGAVADDWYFFMLARKIYPVNFRWLGRDPEVSVDVFHDLGHGLALLDPRYRQLLVRFSRVAYFFLRQSGNHLRLKREIKFKFNQFFEISLIKNTRKIVPLGSVAMMSDCFSRELTRDKSTLSQVRPEHRSAVAIYPNKTAWEAETLAFIRRLEKISRKI